MEQASVPRGKSLDHAIAEKGRDTGNECMMRERGVYLSFEWLLDLGPVAGSIVLYHLGCVVECNRMTL
jgi:hypothetical protein